jgi:serine protein kinase
VTDIDTPAAFALKELDAIASRMQLRFEEGRRVLSFQQYLELFSSDPVRHGRDASRYVRDMFEHYGTRPVRHTWGEVRRFNLFDLPWEPTGEGREAQLVGHEELQNEIYRALSNFAQEGRANRLILMHGPNGSAKSTAAGCILRALENYSTHLDGALYRFHWVFPSRKTIKGSIGFGGERKRSAAEDASYAHLADDEIDARLVMEVRDHPLFLIPIEERRALLRRLHQNATSNGKGREDEGPTDWLMTGRLSHKNQQVFEALLMSNEGSLAEVLRHVQVERYFISRRYRVGAVTIGPQLSVDAGERQITADRSLSALPTALQATTLFEAHGELVEAAGGVLEFSDLLKRPMEAYRYLQLTLETGMVTLNQQNLQVNCVMLGSANDIHLSAFREHPEYPSFRGRFELVRVPYLHSFLDEQEIYDRQIAPYVGRHVAPHATRIAAQFAVLTRLMRPESKNYSNELGEVVSSLTAWEKMELYATGAPPDRLDADDKKRLRAAIAKIYREFDASVEYEGRMGASPRTLRTVLLDAAQHPDYGYLSPFGVLSELDDLCRRDSEYDWLQQKALSGGYHDHREFRELLRHHLLDSLEEDMRTASGIVEETRYSQLFDKYISHVSIWVKKEKIRNPITGDFEDADERMMREVEGLLGVMGNHEDHRRGLIASIAAFAIDHPGERVVNHDVFPGLLRKLRQAVFAERRKPISQMTRDLVTMLRTQKEERAAAEGAAAGGADSEQSDARASDLGLEQRRLAEDMLGRLKSRGYDDDSALDTALVLLRTRFSEFGT